MRVSSGKAAPKTRYNHTNCTEQENCPLDLGPSSNRAVEVHQPPVQVTAGQSSGGKPIARLFVTCYWPAGAHARALAQGDAGSKIPHASRRIFQSRPCRVTAVLRAVPALQNMKTKTLDEKRGFAASLSCYLTRQQLRKKVLQARESTPSCGAKHYPSSPGSAANASHH